MQLFLTLKSMPELRQRSWRERRQALWHAGLKPYRSWRVWVTLVLSGLLALWGVNTVLGNMFMYPELGDSNKAFAAMLTVLLAIVIPAAFWFRHAYLKALRPSLARVKFDPAGSWWGAAFKGLLLDALCVLLFFASMAALDWAINSYDEAPDPRIAAAMSWPVPIPDANNGFVAAMGLQAPAGAAPFEAGVRWMNEINEAVAKHTHTYPESPKGLKYAGYVAKPKEGAKPAKPSPAAVFCDFGTESCWKVMQENRAEVAAWLAANQELLTRYQALQKYLQWQYTIPPDGINTPFPSYQGVMRAQSVFLASAMIAMDKGDMGRGLAMINDDMHFVRNMLGSKDMMIGKMIATSMLSRDLSLLAQTIGQRPNDLKPYWAQIERMVEPLTPAQLSIENALRFEEQFNLSTIERLDLFAQQESGLPSWLSAWVIHHFKKNAMSNQTVRYWSHALMRTEVHDASYTPPLSPEDASASLGISRVTGFMHNLGGKMLSLIAVPNYSPYPNKMFDLNALNNLVRLRLALAKNNIAAKDVPAFLASGDPSLTNPETGKPYEWDAERRQIYFAPATDSFRQHTTLGCGVEGRTGLTVPVAAVAEAGGKGQSGKVK